jgi:hypothetical protein
MQKKGIEVYLHFPMLFNSVILNEGRKYLLDAVKR